MLRFVLLGATLIATAQVVFAGEHVIEIWNPPEARQGTHPFTTARKPQHRKVSVHHALKSGRHPATGPTAKAVTKSRSEASFSKNTSRLKDIPRMMTPEGSVLRVGSHGAGIQVAR